MAVEKGFLFQELTQHTTQLEALKMKLAANQEDYFLNGKTCEKVLSDDVGENYKSIIYLVSDCI